MSVLALLITLSLSPFSHADIPHAGNPQDDNPRADISQQWLCKLEARLVGDPLLYMQNTLDSWSGDAVLTCTTPTLSFSKPVTVLFNGETHYGNNVNASVRLQLYVTTGVSPSFFVLSAAARAKTIGDEIHWKFEETYNNVVHAQGWREDASIGECESLKKGQLRILDRL